MLYGDASAGRIEVESGASLDIGTHVLTASGSVEALGPVTGAGTLVLTGAGATLRGTVPALRIETETTLAGETHVGGVTSVAGATLHFAGFALHIQP